jgi:hypothetical protein
MVAVRHDDLSMAFDFVSYAATMGHNTYVSLDTGKVYWSCDSIDTFDEYVPDDLETTDRYLAISRKNELGPGGSLASRFVAHELPAGYDLAEGFFQERGAYARFKDSLARKDVLERWHTCEADAVEGALRRWCAENGLEILEP